MFKKILSAGLALLMTLSGGAALSGAVVTDIGCAAAELAIDPADIGRINVELTYSNGAGKTCTVEGSQSLSGSGRKWAFQIAADKLETALEGDLGGLTFSLDFSASDVSVDADTIFFGKNAKYTEKVVWQDKTSSRQAYDLDGLKLKRSSSQYKGELVDISEAAGKAGQASVFVMTVEFNLADMYCDTDPAPSYYHKAFDDISAKLVYYNDNGATYEPKPMFLESGGKLKWVYDIDIGELAAAMGDVETIYCRLNLSFGALTDMSPTMAFGKGSRYDEFMDCKNGSGFGMHGALMFYDDLTFNGSAFVGERTAISNANSKRMADIKTLRFTITIDAATMMPADFVFLGDINDDGKIDINDLALLAAHIKGVRKLSEAQLKAANVNRDEALDFNDLSLLAAHIKGVSKI